MPVRDSEAIVLRSFPLGEADRLVSFLTRSYGRLRGVARGARRPRSRFGAALEPISYIRIWFYERETRQLVRISQAELIESFLDVQRDYAASVALALVAEIAEAVLPEREASDPAFRLILLVARTIRETGQVPLALAYFALWMIRLGGWLPSFEHCSNCGQPFASAGAWTSPGGLACRNCRLGDAAAVSRAALDAARRMLEDRLDRLAKADASAPDDLREFLLGLVEHHIERKLHSRAMLEVAR
jgi:DNA repair protein RecO (recombination protein O)